MVVAVSKRGGEGRLGRVFVNSGITIPVQLGGQWYLQWIELSVLTNSSRLALEGPLAYPSFVNFAYSVVIGVMDCKCWWNYDICKHGTGNCSVVLGTKHNVLTFYKAWRKLSWLILYYLITTYRFLLWLSVRSRKLEIGLLFLLFVEQGAKNAREEKQLREEVYCHLFIYFSTIFPGFVYMLFCAFPKKLKEKEVSIS